MNLFTHIYEKHPIERGELSHFKEWLDIYKENLKKLENQNEKNLVANALKPFFESLNFERI